MSNTTGAWDMYGQDGDRRYPALQAEFFNRAGAALSRRESLLGFVALSGIGAITVWGAKGSKDAQLPITKGPQTTGENGKGGSVRSRL
jgi:photosystem I subunit VI